MITHVSAFTHPKVAIPMPSVPLLPKCHQQENENFCQLGVHGQKHLSPSPSLSLADPDLTDEVVSSDVAKKAEVRTCRTQGNKAALCCPVTIWGFCA